MDVPPALDCVPAAAPATSPASVLGDAPVGRPTLSRRKSAAWIVLTMNVGATLVFFVLCFIEGPPREILIYLWPLSTSALCVLSARDLRHSYRLEPESFAGFCQLSIIDLYAVIVFAAVLMAQMRAVWPRYFVPSGIAIALIVSAAYLFCVLLASRRGYVQALPKYLSAFASLLIGYGWMVVCSLLIICIVLARRGEVGGIVTFFGDTFLGHVSQNTAETGLYSAWRIGLAALPLGLRMRALIGPPSLKLPTVATVH